MACVRARLLHFSRGEIRSRAIRIQIWTAPCLP